MAAMEISGKKEFSSYKEITESPEKHLDFLREIDARTGAETNGSQLYAALKADIKVNGEPFSQARHLTTLESQSDRWDFDETAEGTKSEIARLSEKIKTVDPTYDFPHFTTGYAWMVSELKERPAIEPGGKEAPLSATKTNQNDTLKADVEARIAIEKNNDELLSVPQNGMDSATARRVVREDIGNFSGITNEPERRFAAIAMGDNAEKQTAYKTELASISPGIAKEAETARAVITDYERRFERENRKDGQYSGINAQTRQPELFSQAEPKTATAWMHDNAKKAAQSNIEILKNNPALATRPADELERLAYWRGVVTEKNKDQPQAAQAASLARFDQNAANPEFLKKLEQATSPALEPAEKTAHEKPQGRDQDWQSL